MIDDTNVIRCSMCGKLLDYEIEQFDKDQTYLAIYVDPCPICKSTEYNRGFENGREYPKPA